jgi:putative spermidine/putrescine transport system permease protein
VKRSHLVLAIVTFGYFAILYVPFVLMAILSFQGPNGGPTFPLRGFSTQWYEQVLGVESGVAGIGVRLERIGEPLQRSLLLAFMATLVSTSLALVTAIPFRRQFHGSAALFYFLLLGAVTPGLALGVGYALLAQELDLKLSLLTSGLAAHVAWTFPFAFVVMLITFNRFDRALEEASRTLGATEWTTFRRVTLPLVVPGLLTAALFSFTLSFDEYIRSQFAAGVDQTLPLKILGLLGGRVTPALYALGSLTTAVSIVVVVVLLGSAGYLLKRRRRHAQALPPDVAVSG